MGKKYQKAASKLKQEDLIKPNLSLDFKIDQKFHLNENHKSFVENSLDDSSNIIFVDGFAGTNKSYLMVFIALTLLKTKKVEEILYIRSIAESATIKLGSLPGEVGDKFKPWMIPLLEKCDELIGPIVTNQLLESEYIKCVPVNFLRGATFSNSVVIVDEAQNLTASELTTIITRFGKNCKLFVAGDSNQIDIQKSGFSRFFEAFNTDQSKEHGIITARFTEEDITRSKLLKYIVSVINGIKSIPAK